MAAPSFGINSGKQQEVQNNVAMFTGSFLTRPHCAAFASSGTPLNNNTGVTETIGTTKINGFLPTIESTIPFMNTGDYGQHYSPPRFYVSSYNMGAAAPSTAFAILASQSAVRKGTVIRGGSVGIAEEFRFVGTAVGTVEISIGLISTDGTMKESARGSFSSSPIANSMLGLTVGTEQIAEEGDRLYMKYEFTNFGSTHDTSNYIYGRVAFATTAGSGQNIFISFK